MSLRTDERIYGSEAKAQDERLRRSRKAGEYLDDFTGLSDGALVEVDGQLCIRPLTIDEKADQALVALGRLPKCLKRI